MIHVIKLHHRLFTFILIFLFSAGTVGAMGIAANGGPLDVFDKVCQLRMPVLIQSGPFGTLEWPDSKLDEDTTYQEFIDSQIASKLAFREDADSLRKTCTLLKFSGYWQDQAQRMVLDESTIHDLSILSDSQSTYDNSLLSKVALTITHAGKATLAAQLIGPYKDFQALNRRSSLIKGLGNNQDFMRLWHIMELAKEGEPGFISFAYFDPNDPMARYILDEKNLCSTKDGPSFLDRIWTDSEFVSLAKEIVPVITPVVSLSMEIFPVTGWINKLYCLLNSENNADYGEYQKLLQEAGFKKPSISTPEGIFHTILQCIVPESFSSFVGTALSMKEGAVGVLASLRSTRDRFVALKGIQKKNSFTRVNFFVPLKRHELFSTCQYFFI